MKKQIAIILFFISMTLFVDAEIKPQANNSHNILDFSYDNQSLKFKKINIGGSWSHGNDTEISYIIKLSHSSYTDFNVYVLFLDNDGFEIARHFLGGCLGDKSLAFSNINGEKSTQNIPAYNLKGTLWIPSKIYPRICSAELKFYEQTKQ